MSYLDLIGSDFGSNLIGFCRSYGTISSKDNALLVSV